MLKTKNKNKNLAKIYSLSAQVSSHFGEAKKFMAGIMVTIMGVALLNFGLVSAQGTSSGFINPGDSPSRVAAATGGQTSARALILTIVNFFLGFLGLLAVLMVIYGGMLVLTSQGEADKAGKGKKILTFAAMGIIIILLSFAFVNTILGAATGQDG